MFSDEYLGVFMIYPFQRNTTALLPVTPNVTPAAANKLKEIEKNGTAVFTLKSTISYKIGDFPVTVYFVQDNVPVQLIAQPTASPTPGSPTPRFPTQTVAPTTTA